MAGSKPSTTGPTPSVSGSAIDTKEDCALAGCRRLMLLPASCLDALHKRTISTMDSLSHVSLAVLRADHWRPRLSCMRRELDVAWNSSDRALLEGWLLGIAKDFGIVLTRRVSNFGRLIGSVGTALSSETREAVAAYRGEVLREHAKKRRNSLVDSTRAVANRSGEFIKTLRAALTDRPADVAPQLLTIVVTSLLTSGGPDGDGGVPDLDLEFGIGAHRSVLSHSILAGAALESGFLALIKLVQLVHKQLPRDHDPIWDSIQRQSLVLLEAANTGASLGLAYHLLIDGLAQPAAYHGVPIEMPMPVHQAIFTASGTAEGLDALHKDRTASGTTLRDTHPRAGSAAEHARRRSERLALPDELLRALTAREAELLMRYGRWMEGLVSGELVPLTPEQSRFVDVATGKLEPTTEYERVWIRYRLLLGQMKT